MTYFTDAMEHITLSRSNEKGFCAKIGILQIIQLPQSCCRKLASLHQGLRLRPSKIHLKHSCDLEGRTESKRGHLIITKCMSQSLLNQQSSRADQRNNPPDWITGQITVLPPTLRCPLNNRCYRSLAEDC
ncbi:hypothetical protein J6590_026335 [Homalodisca vitripennis]|nr:hypothetical protein J6590_026335 [Homalodisca vitripennis]